jgi:AcrR family transcriptional regulator
MRFMDSSVAHSPTRDRILRAAKTLFSSRGYEHASTSAISRQAGTSESQLMKYFGSKSGLLEAIFQDGWTPIVEEARRTVEGMENPFEKLQVISGLALAALERDQEMKLLMLFESRRMRKEGLSLSPGFLGFVHLIDETLAEMRAADLLRPGLSADAVRSALMGMLEGMLRDRFLAERTGFPADFGAMQVGEMLTLALASFTNGQRQASGA